MKTETRITDPLPRLVSPWNALTLTKLVIGASRTRAHDVVYADAPDVADWLYREARVLSYCDLANEARSFARKLMTLGLKPGDSVMLVLPNSVEFAIAAHGTMLAGCVPVLASIALSSEKMRYIAELSDAKAIITIAKLLNLDLARTMRNLAAQLYGVKAVAAFGQDLPEGVVALDGWDDADLTELVEFTPVGVNQISLITVEFIGEIPRALCRTQGQLIAETIALSSTAHSGGQSKLINTIMPGSAFSFISSIVLPVLVRAELHFHGIFSSKVLVEQIENCISPTLIAPLAVEQGIAELDFDILKTINTCILLNRFEQASASLSGSVLLGPVVDVTALGEAAHICLARKVAALVDTALADGASGGSQVRRPRAYPQNLRQPGMRVVENDMLLVRARVKPDSQLHLSGFGIASPYGAALGGSMENGLETQLYACVAEGQTFRAFDPDYDMDVSHQDKQSAA